ncbi:hypothetical protein L1049_014964 [Liquidambar formosana]|uniref:Fe2OG dioxygenase domain-containing protein n=1 Tax=Liquidambar formosana TaxID=63359 RepID=A0AAP0S432_LIQFO
MSREFSGEMPESAVEGDLMGLLQTLDREEIMEVLSEGICQHCQSLLQSRIHSLINGKASKTSLSNDKRESSDELSYADASSLCSSGNRSANSTIMSRRQESTSWSSTPESVYSVRQKGYAANLSSPALANGKRRSFNGSGSGILLNDGISGVSSFNDDELLDEQNEGVRFSQVGRKKDYVHIERIGGKAMNVLKGLELHTRVFNVEEQRKIVECVYSLQRMGQKGQLRARTYSEPRKWMRGKGRVTLQFGCCYNYAVDKNGNPPGIIRDEEVDPLPRLFKQMIKRMVRWHVLPPTCVPDSCIVNIYEEGDCIPPHIDHHDFLRPFCTVSFLTECNILFGSNLKIVDAGEFLGPVSIPLPVGSVFILNGNGADIAKHCVPAVPTTRISITFRKMDDSKLPYKFLPDPELLGVKPLSFTKSPVQQHQHRPYQYQNKERYRVESEMVGETSDGSFVIERDDFPPLGGSNSVSRHRGNKVGFK